jgi:hypothetical protein
LIGKFVLFDIEIFEAKLGLWSYFERGKSLYGRG